MRAVVVGAGAIGLTTAVSLRAAGHAVTLIAPELPGPGEGPSVAHQVRGATHAAAGMLAPVGETQFSQDALGGLLHQGWAAYPELIELLGRFTDAPTGFRAQGSWIVAADAADARAWSRLLDHAGSRGRRVEPIAVSRLRRVEPALAPGLAQAHEAPDDHQVDPRLLVRACLAALTAETGPGGAPLPETAGPPATLLPGTVVAARQRGEDAVLDVAESAAGALHADVAVLAAGLGHRDIGGAPAEEPLALRPVHGDVLRLRVREEQLLPGEEHLLGRTVRALVGGRQVYLVPRADRTLVVGASSREDGLAGSHAGSVLDLLADAAAVLPAVRECELLEVTAAARPGTPDDAPRVAALRGAPRLIVAAGFHRHGILLAPWAAERAVDLVDAMRRGSADDAATPPPEPRPAKERPDDGTDGDDADDPHDAEQGRNDA
ncbi:FAD-dependent oxidoreductase [uncultured Micrococcus sp.]|uniref:FAD-dependent oxidoreductase n=1 Tax=uncultured Micrococcus sp. TaxID=114051 RepID=UPI002599CB12|nr:FAD-dependent oxidoreductase [uncultured Micrococcus sp.]